MRAAKGMPIAAETEFLDPPVKPSGDAVKRIKPVGDEVKRIVIRRLDRRLRRWGNAPIQQCLRLTAKPFGWFRSFLLALMLVSVPAFAVAVDERPLDDPALEAEARMLMKEIRCLVCQNQSIEDSNADLAKDLRTLVRERVALGDSPDNVRAYLVDRYGDWVMLEPPIKPSTYFLWASPFLFIVLVGLGIVSRRRAAGPAPLSDTEKARLAAILKDGEDEA